MSHKHTLVHIPEKQFFEEYEPIPRDDEQLIRDHAETLEFPRDSVWSIVEGNNPDNLYALPGYRIVNVIGYIVTKKFWESELIEAEYYIKANNP